MSVLPETWNSKRLRTDRQLATGLIIWYILTGQSLDIKQEIADMDIIKTLYDYFPTSVYTGNSLVFISEDWRVELKEYKNTSFSANLKTVPIVRVKVFKKALNGEFLPGHYEDFQIDSVGELAAQIERYIQFSIGQNLRENV